MEASAIISSVLISGWFVLLAEMLRSANTKIIDNFRIFIFPISLYLVSMVLAEISNEFALVFFSIALLTTVSFMLPLSQRLKYDIETELAEKKIPKTLKP